jgi:hypothetical protein
MKSQKGISCLKSDCRKGYSWNPKKGFHAWRATVISVLLHRERFKKEILTLISSFRNPKKEFFTAYSTQHTAHSVILYFKCNPVLFSTFTLPVILTTLSQDRSITRTHTLTIGWPVRNQYAQMIESTLLNLVIELLCTGAVYDVNIKIICTIFKNISFAICVSPKT